MDDTKTQPVVTTTLNVSATFTDPAWERLCDSYVWLSETQVRHARNDFDDPFTAFLLTEARSHGYRVLGVSEAKTGITLGSRPTTSYEGSVEVEGPADLLVPILRSALRMSGATRVTVGAS